MKAFHKQRAVLIAILIIQSTGVIAQKPYEDSKLERGAFTLHFKIFGDTGPYLVILSGGPGSTVDYMQPIADSLSKYYRCIMLEQRGTRRSVLKKYDSTNIHMDLYVQDIEALRKHLKAKKLLLVGNSWGALLALLYGMDYPKNVSAIISLGFGIISTDYAAIANDNVELRLTSEEKAIRSRWEDKLKDSSSFLQANYERDKAGMAIYYYDRRIALKAANAFQLSDYNYYVEPAFYKSHPRFDLRPELYKIKAPVLFVHGRQDFAGETNIIETHQLIRRSKLKFIERCGHYPWEEKPTETWKAIFDFLEIK